MKRPMTWALHGAQVDVSTPAERAMFFGARQRRQLRLDREADMSLRALARKYGTTAPTFRRTLSAMEPPP